MCQTSTEKFKPHGMMNPSCYRDRLQRPFTILVVHERSALAYKGDVTKGRARVVRVPILLCHRFPSWYDLQVRHRWHMLRVRIDLPNILALPCFI